MLHTKFRGNWPTGSGEFYLIQACSQLGHVTNIISMNFIPLQTKFGKTGHLVSEKTKFQF